MRYSRRITYHRSGCSRIMQPPTQPGQNTGAPVSQVVGAPMGGQVIAPMGGQVIYVHFKPSPNFRHISYMVLGGGLLLSFIGMMLSYNSSSFEDGFFLLNCASSICCGSISIACVLDAMYYSSKIKWQQSTGAQTGGSTFGMVVDILFAFIAFLFTMMYLFWSTAWIG
mgnify:FL=1